MVNSVVAECNDWRLNAIRKLSVRPEHVLDALDRADARVPEGAVGAGTGMICYRWKGGIGTSSRIAGDTSYVVGVLALCNFGQAQDLTICGVRVGQKLIPPPTTPVRNLGSGSCVFIVGTDAPVSSRQLNRLARRIQSGIARTGTFTAHGSGEYAIAFSTCQTIPHWHNSPVLSTTELMDASAEFNALLEATVEASEEAVLNCLFTADAMSGRDGSRCGGMPAEPVARFVTQTLDKARAQ